MCNMMDSGLTAGKNWGQVCMCQLEDHIEIILFMTVQQGFLKRSMQFYS